MTRKPKLILWLLLPADLLVRLALAFRPLKYIDGYVIPDDAYLALTLARNIAKGWGPLYGLDFTNGFQPLYVFLMAPVYRIFPNDHFAAVHAALVLLTIFDVLSLGVILLLIRQFSESDTVLILAGLAWIFNPWVMLTTANGLETMIAFFFIALTYYSYHRLRLCDPVSATVARLLAFGMLLGLATLARIDGAIFAAAMAVSLAIAHFRARQKMTSVAGSLLWVGCGAALAYLPWLAYSIHYTGDFFPVSGRAVRFLSLANIGDQQSFEYWLLFVIRRSTATVVKYNAIFIVISLLALAAILMKYREGIIGELRVRLEPHWPLFAYAIAMFLVYTFYIFTVWYFKRYLFPLILISILISSALIDLLNAVVGKGRGRFAMNVAIGAMIVLSCLFHPLFSTFYFSRDTATMGYMNLGLWADKHFAPGTVVGSCQTGALGYFAERLTVINLDGVVNKSCFEELRRKRAIEYMKKAGVDYYIDWEFNRRFIEKESRNFKEGDLVAEEKIEEFTSWRHEWLVYRVNRDR